MTRTLLAAALALATLGSVSAYADGGRDPSLYGRPAAAQTQTLTEGRNAAFAAPTADAANANAAINQQVQQNARSTN